MDEMERQRCYKVLEKLTPEELNDAKTIVQKSIEIGDLLSEITIMLLKKWIRRKSACNGNCLCTEINDNGG